MSLAGLAGSAVQLSVHDAAQEVDDIDVLPFVEAADIVFLPYLAVVKDGVDGPGMVFDEEPVADVLAFAIDRKRFMMKDIVDHEGDQLFREMVGAVVI